MNSNNNGDWTTNGSEELKLASSHLPAGLKRKLIRLHRRLGSAFTLMLLDLEADLPAHLVAQRWNLRPYQVVLWRKVIAIQSRKLIPELAIFTDRKLTYIQGGLDDAVDTDAGSSRDAHLRSGS